MNTQAPCTCDVFVHPAEIFNPPGLASIAYRAGDFTSFRRALLLARPGESALKLWRPGGRGDLAVQLVEWWAVLADILTFYNERIANESYLRTATERFSLLQLARMIGYELWPGVAPPVAYQGATGEVLHGKWVTFHEGPPSCSDRQP